MSETGHRKILKMKCTLYVAMLKDETEIGAMERTLDALRAGEVVAFPMVESLEGIDAGDPEEGGRDE